MAQLHTLLLGLKHCGKSTLGRLCAAHLAVEFVDLDSIAARLLQTRGEALPSEPAATAIRRYYLCYGRDAFRALEYAAAGGVMRQVHRNAESKQATICALGGGTPENEAAYAVLRPGSYAIYLRERPEILFERIMTGGAPPFFEGEDPWQAFQTLARRRDELYMRSADKVLELGGRGIEDLTEELIQHVKELKDAR